MRKLVDDLREAIKDENTARIKTLSEELQQAAYALSTQAYEQAQHAEEQPVGAAAGTARSSDEDVIEAEFTPTDEGVGSR
jgi:molecular chaperone DnaK